jgi:hypothetical protein
MPPAPSAGDPGPGLAFESRSAPLRPSATPAAQPDRPLTEDERELIVGALVTLRDMGKNRDFPCLFAEMHRMIGGPTFKLRNFNGYGSAMAMMSRAVVEGIVQFGPPDANGVPTVYLPEEDVPQPDAEERPEAVSEPA